MYLDMSKVLKPPEKKHRDLKLYPRLRFDTLYYDFNERKYKGYESPAVRMEWKRIIGLLNELNKSIWSIARMRRETAEWTKRKIQSLHTKIFNLSILIRDLHESLLSVISEEEVVWKNYLYNLAAGAVEGIKLTRDDIREFNPSIKISSFRLILRQIFIPVQQLVDSIEQELIDGKVDEAKIAQLEDSLLLRVLPWFYRMFRRAVNEA